MDATVRIVAVFFGSNPNFTWELFDVDGAFLQGRFKNGEKMYVGKKASSNSMGRMNA